MAGLDWDWKTSRNFETQTGPRPCINIIFFSALCCGRLTGRSGNLPTLPKASLTLLDGIGRVVGRTMQTRLVERAPGQRPHSRVCRLSQTSVLEIDISYADLGAVLFQEQVGQWRFVAYASQGLRPKERKMSNYSSRELVFIALKWVVKTNSENICLEGSVLSIQTTVFSATYALRSWEQ